MPPQVTSAGVLSKRKKREKELGIKEPIAPGSRPLGIQLTPEQEFRAAEQERRIIMEGGREIRNIIPKQVQQLAFQQQQELKALEEEMKQLEPKELTDIERSAAAGRAVLRNIAAQAGIEGPPEPIEQPRGLIKFGQAAVGTLATTPIFLGRSAAQLLSPQGATISELQSDAAEKLAEAKRISIAATSKGADINQAIKSLDTLEQGIRERYAKAHLALRKSPQDIREGIDFIDEMSRDLRTIIEYRQALERYRLTGDTNQVLLNTGTFLPENI